MTANEIQGAAIQVAVARCEREQHHCEQVEPPCMGAKVGWMDWELERRLLMEQAKAVERAATQDAPGWPDVEGAINSLLEAQDSFGVQEAVQLLQGMGAPYRERDIISTLEAMDKAGKVRLAQDRVWKRKRELEVSIVTIADVFSEGLLAKGYTERKGGKTKRYRVFEGPHGNFGGAFYVGSSGALRVGRSVTGSIPAGPKTRQAVFQAGRKALEGRGTTVVVELKEVA